MTDRDLSCGCSVIEDTGHAVLDGKLLKLCKLHVDWMTECVASSAAWQPIASAPEGQKVLLFGKGGICIDDWGGYCVHNQPKFTHWMPLPAPPEANK